MEYEVRPGMYVLSLDGQKMGRIASIDGERFEVVRGSREPEGFAMDAGEICSRLQSSLFLRLPLHEYAGRYRSRERAAPRPVKKGGRRFLLFRKAEVRW